MWRLEGAKLNGTNEYFVIPDRDNLSFGDGANDKCFSINALVNMDDAVNFYIVSKGVYNTDAEWYLTTSGVCKASFMLFDESVINNYIGRYYNYELTSYEGQWVCIAANYSGRGGANAEDGMNIYLNGIEVDDTDYKCETYVAMENLTHDVWVGRYHTNYVKGKIRNIKIWNRVVGTIEDSRRNFEESRK